MQPAKVMLRKEAPEMEISDSAEEPFEMEISRRAMEIAREIAIGGEMEDVVKKIARRAFSKPSKYIMDRLKELAHENLIQTIRELV